MILSLGGEVLERSEHEVEPFGSDLQSSKMTAGLHDAFVSNDYSLAQRTSVVLRT